MSLKSVLFAAVVVLSSTLAQAQTQTCPTLEDLPSSFTAEEQLFTIGTDMVMNNRGSRLGAAIQRTMNWTTTFELQNARGEIVATAQERMFTWGITIDVNDCQGHRIGTLKEEVFATFFSGFENVYSILDASGQVIGSSTRRQFFDTNVSITNNSGAVVMNLHRDAFQFFGHSWNVTLGSGAHTIDDRLLLMIPAFKTAADREDHSRSSDDD